MSNAYKVARVNGDTITWTPVTVPAGHATGFEIVNGGSANMRYRTDFNDVNTEIGMTSGKSDSILSDQRQFPRFATGEVVLYIQFDAGTGPAIIRWLL